MVCLASAASKFDCADNEACSVGAFLVSWVLGVSRDAARNALEASIASRTCSDEHPVRAATSETVGER